MSAVFFTIGHSTWPAAQFVGMLRQQRVRHLVDVRRFPSSRRHPQFNQGPLAETLAAAGIEYTHEVALGGRRPARKSSPNKGWEDEGFRGYADYMATRDFAEALTRLEMYARLGTVCLMCAEGHWRHCHRQLIADALLARGHTVRHILPEGGTAPHALTPFVVLEGEQIQYPAPQRELELE